MTQRMDGSSSKAELDAVFLYMGILDAYEAVGTELIGTNVLAEHVLPRMVYYVREFLPEVFSDRGDSDALVTELSEFLEAFRGKIDQAREQASAQDFTMEEIWKLRAAIFGYESVFIKILGDAAIRNYVLVRISDILAAYLPEDLLDPKLELKEKLEAYAKYLKDRKFVRYAHVRFDKNGIRIATNWCAFSRIHDSEAYRNLDVRFCPWGMIGSSIVAAHESREALLDSSQFTTRGTISKIITK
ncbi:MAG: hypothetical protein ACW97A_03210 [Candidatus Thorarchaeota archaeon]